MLTVGIGMSPLPRVLLQNHGNRLELWPCAFGASITVVALHSVASNAGYFIGKSLAGFKVNIMCRRFRFYRCQPAVLVAIFCSKACTLSYDRVRSAPSRAPNLIFEDPRYLYQCSSHPLLSNLQRGPIRN